MLKKPRIQRTNSDIERAPKSETVNLEGLLWWVNCTRPPDEFRFWTTSVTGLFVLAPYVTFNINGACSQVPTSTIVSLTAELNFIIPDGDDSQS